MKNIAIRVDASTEVGMGHLMRCQTLAKEFIKAGFYIFFFTKTKQIIENEKQANAKALQLVSLDYENEAKETIKLCEIFHISFLLIDTYMVSYQYFIDIKKANIKIAYVDDINKFVYPVDILINGNVGITKDKYQGYSDKELFLLGASYNLIREEFKSQPERILKKEVDEILVTTGGVDDSNVSTLIINILREVQIFKETKINVVVGSFFENVDILENIANLDSNIILHKNVKMMSTLMKGSDIAISSSGSTLYQLCACGTPTLSLILSK